MHICLFDRKCWRDWREFGMPLRVHWGVNNRKFVTVFPGRWKRIWEEGEPVDIDVKPVDIDEEIDGENTGQSR